MLSDADLQKLDQSSHAWCNEAAREIRELRAKVEALTFSVQSLSECALREALADVALDGGTRRPR